jgi:hypothetical protein
MSAMDAFQEFLSSLTDEDRARLEPYIRTHRADLFAARSEDARMRIASTMMQEAREALGAARRP